MQIWFNFEDFLSLSFKNNEIDCLKVETTLNANLKFLFASGKTFLDCIEKLKNDKLTYANYVKIDTEIGMLKKNHNLFGVKLQTISSCLFWFLCLILRIEYC